MPSRYRYWVSHEMMVLQFLLAIPLDPRPPTLHDFAGDQSEEFNLGALRIKIWTGHSRRTVYVTIPKAAGVTVWADCYGNEPCILIINGGMCVWCAPKAYSVLPAKFYE